jgi:hypothetical protein
VKPLRCKAGYESDPGMTVPQLIRFLQAALQAVPEDCVVVVEGQGVWAPVKSARIVSDHDDVSDTYVGLDVGELF